MASVMIGIIEGLLNELKALPYGENRQRAIEGLISAKFFLQRAESEVYIVQKPSDLVQSAQAVNQIIEPAPRTVQKEFNADLESGAELALKVNRSTEIS